MSKQVRHVLGLSGGKDSAALALYMRDRVPEMEYFFCDTGRELPETYEYLQRLETVLGKPIARLNADRDFDHWLWVYGGALPSPQMRWCTRMLKIKPLEAWIGDAQTFSYIGIRADENRAGYISRKPNITPVRPIGLNTRRATGVAARYRSTSNPTTMVIRIAAETFAPVSTTRPKAGLSATRKTFVVHFAQAGCGSNMSVNTFAMTASA